MKVKELTPTYNCLVLKTFNIVTKSGIITADDPRGNQLNLGNYPLEVVSVGEDYGNGQPSINKWCKAGDFVYIQGGQYLTVNVGGESHLVVPFPAVISKASLEFEDGEQRIAIKPEAPESILTRGNKDE